MTALVLIVGALVFFTVLAWVEEVAHRREARRFDRLVVNRTRRYGNSSRKPW